MVHAIRPTARLAATLAVAVIAAASTLSYGSGTALAPEPAKLTAPLRVSRWRNGRGLLRKQPCVNHRLQIGRHLRHLLGPTWNPLLTRPSRFR